MQRKLPIALVVVAMLAAATFHFFRRADAPSAVAATAAAHARAESAAQDDANRLAASATPSKSPAHASPKKSPSASGATAALPPPGTPLKSILADLKQRADEGDAAASSRLYRDLRTCAAVQRIDRQAPTMSGNRLLNQDVADMSPEELRSGERRLGRLQGRLDFARDNAALCDDLAASDFAELVPATLQAAQQGDAQAAACYVGANPGSWAGLLDNPQWVSDYKDNALPLANSAIEQGNWAMVGIMVAAYDGNARSANLLGQVTGTDPAQAYTYAKLMNLGQPAGGPSSPRAANFLSSLAAQLTPEQVQAADAQAQKMFQQYFDGASRESGESTMAALRDCESGGGFGSGRF